MYTINILFRNFKSLFTLLVLSFLFICNTTIAQQNTNKNQTEASDSALTARRQMIHSRSKMVMPFNMNKVTHYFIKTNDGGILMIKAKNPKDEEQINLIRGHLKKEYNLFSKADFKDPKTLHGMNMPGLKTLTKSKGKYKVEYKELKDGARLTFISKDTTVIKALHTWFNAQLRDHGNDAKSHE